MFQFNHFFPSIRFHKSIGSGYQYYQQPIEVLDVPGFSPFYGLHLAIWQLRSHDLQKDFPLDSVEGRVGFLAWCVVHGRKEYSALSEFRPFWNVLAQPADITVTRYSVAITRLMALVVTARLDLQIDQKLTTETQQFALLQWFCLHGWKELDLCATDIADEQRKFFEKKLPTGFTFIETLIYESRPDLQSLFNLKTLQGQSEYNLWLQEHGAHETILSLLQSQHSVSLPHYNVSNVIFGVNLIGYAFGELGIGEDVRMAALALDAANIPFTVINFRPGDDIRQNDRSIAQWVTDTPIYPINIVCLTALEHLRFYAEQGEALLKNRYTIGYWPWELKNWPINWQHCFSLTDEVWVSSQHTRYAAELVSPVPVLTMPMAVALPQVKRYTRKQWALPASDYLFVFSFDGNSSLARKNPLGVIEAFQKAFPNGHEPVGLVIKCMRPDVNNPAWQTILRFAKHDSRIHIIDRMLSKSDVLGLYKLCDCFVSLHRAEGFGRGIAEALLLGLKVIATNHGGNVDFCLQGMAYLVPFEPIAVGEDDYVESFGQYWANPDIYIAANIMRNVASDGRKRKKTVASTIQKQFLPHIIGEHYRKRLRYVFANIP
ncbi:MAG: glycosyltransferase [Methylobacter sp.]